VHKAKSTANQRKEHNVEMYNIVHSVGYNNAVPDNTGLHSFV